MVLTNGWFCFTGLYYNMYIENTNLVVVVFISRTGRLWLWCLLTRWISIHDVHKWAFILSYLDSFYSVKGVLTTGTTLFVCVSLCVSLLYFAFLSASLLNAVNTVPCLRCVHRFVDIRLQPCSPDTPPSALWGCLCSLYLTFWTTRGPEIELQWHRRSPPGWTAASVMETMAVHTNTVQYTRSRLNVLLTPSFLWYEMMSIKFKVS